MTYKAKITFRDLQDNEYIYQAGEVYPREGYEPSKERVAEVLEKRRYRTSRAVKRAYSQRAQSKT